MESDLVSSVISNLPSFPEPPLAGKDYIVYVLQAVM